MTTAATGKIWASETREYTDRKTGVRVQQLTNYRGHSHHFYFTNPGWYDGGKKLLFSSDRNNRTNLFSLTVKTGEIQQLTDLEPLPLPREVEFLLACVNPISPEAYYWYGAELRTLNLDTLENRTLYRMPDGFDVSMINCTADGRHVVASVFEDKSDEFEVDLLRGYVGFTETWAAHPLSRVERVAVDGSGSETMWEEKCWIGHVNTSPTQNHLMTFCHEGPWDKVDHRVWGLDMASGKTWKIRPAERGEAVGHEYWYADGERVGFHGRNEDGSQFIGYINADNTRHVEVNFPGQTGHIHSNHEKIIVGDGGGVVRLWQQNGDTYDKPRVLCEHLSSMKTQQQHVHPRFTPDGSQVLFTTDVSGYGNVYLVDVPEFSSLPEVESE